MGLDELFISDVYTELNHQGDEFSGMLFINFTPTRLAPAILTAAPLPPLSTIMDGVGFWLTSILSCVYLFPSTPPKKQDAFSVIVSLETHSPFLALCLNFQ